MKVFFTCSYSGKEKYQSYFDGVIKAIQKNKVDLISTETGTYLNVLNRNRKEKLITPAEVHYESIKRAIFEADVVIIDNSHESFRLGHEATLAVQQNKPTLVLSIHKDLSRFIKYPHFFGAKYTKYTIQEIIDNFLKKAEKKLLSKRFNMFVSEEQYEFLDKQAKSEGVTMSQYLRKLIEKDSN